MHRRALDACLARPERGARRPEGDYDGSWTEYGYLVGEPIEAPRPARGRRGHVLRPRPGHRFKGRSRLAPGYTLWIAGRLITEDEYTLFGEPPVSTTAGTWHLTVQVGGDAQKGATFEIVAVPVPRNVSDYLHNASDYEGRFLVPHGDGAPVGGLRSTVLPPGSDIRHSDSIKVRRKGTAAGC
ncbi:hypothetical protein [Streptomyces sp. NPDC004267]|uniref:hypothetical protein n=1 Tax=Streptomyces sp. NPDC004267 TaxID=3364694 RepID=UPI0036834980